MNISDEFCLDEEYHEVDNDPPVKEIVLESTRQEDFDEEAIKDLLESKC